MEEIDLQTLLDFTKLTNEYASIERVIHLAHRDAQENDLEHAGQLALVSWFLAKRHAPHLSLERIFQYALAHDLVEVYAGDVYIHDTNKQKHEQKEANERDAAEKIQKRFPAFSELHTAILGYLNKEDEESVFVYKVDKLVAPINIYLAQGRTWKEKNVSLEMIIKHKTEKIGEHFPTRNYFDALRVLLEENEKKLFVK